MGRNWTSAAPVLLVLLLTLAGCSGLEPGYEPPAVGLTSFRALPGEGLAPRFEIGLHIINPNRDVLHLAGLVYSIKLEGHRVLTGVRRDLPVIPGYGEADVTLVATTDLLSSIRLLGDLLEQPRDTFHYEFDAKLDPGGLRPTLHVQEQGQVRIAPARP